MPQHSLGGRQERDSASSCLFALSYSSCAGWDLCWGTQGSSCPEPRLLDATALQSDPKERGFKVPASNGLPLNWRRGFAAGCRGRRELAPAWVRFPARRLPPVINPNQALLCIQARRLGLEGRNKERSRGLGRGRRPCRSCRLPTLGTSRPLPRGEGARTCRGARSARSSRHRRRGRQQERRVQIRLHLSHPADASPRASHWIA